MKTSKMFKLFLIGFTAVAFTACTGDDDNDNNEPPVSDEEVITTLRLTFTDPEGVIAPQTFTYSDPDGPGGNDPVVDVISVQPSASYVVTIEVLDESNPNDVDNITEEIAAEDDEHQFFIIAEGGAADDLTISYNDFDGNDNPIGLSTTWTVLNPTSGNVRVILLHEPDKDAEGIAIDNPQVAGGETDIEVVFEFIAQ